MENIIKAAAVCVPAALLSAVIKKDNPAMALLLALAASCLTVYYAVSALQETLGVLRDMANGAGMTLPVLSAVFKTAGIAVIAAFAADACDEAGMKTASSAVNLAGGAASLMAAMPIVKSVLSMLESLL